MPKLSEEARKKIAEAVRKSWVARRARQAGASKPAARAKSASKGQPRGKLSLEARRKIAEAVKKSWAARRARGGRAAGSQRTTRGTGGSVVAAIDQASQTLKNLTLDDIRGSNHRGVPEKLEELAVLASDLKRLLGR